MMNLFKFKKEKFIFTDQFGNKFWLYDNIDNIKPYQERGSVTDAINVINYINKNVTTINVGLDLGANLGGVSVAMWNKASPEGSIYSIEADPMNIVRLHQNLSLNNHPQHNILNIAVADKIGSINLKRFPKNYNGWQTIAKTIANHANDIKVENVLINTNTLDNLLDFYNLKKIDLIKIDIEGAELMALNSIRDRLLSKSIKKIIFEVNQLTLEPFNESIKSLLQYWCNTM